MAHFPPLPGSPRLRREARHGRRDRLGRRRHRASCRPAASTRSCSATRTTGPTCLKATPESLAAMATAVGDALKPMLKVPFGVNYLWDPRRHAWRSACATGARFGREIFTGVYRLGHGPVGARLRRRRSAAPRSRPRRPQAAVQHQRRVRRSARYAADRAARDERGVLLARRRDLRVRADDRPGRRQRRAHARARRR